ncbi:MAG: hypothetical protein NTV38_01365 [Chloroflexi bacterium]|nr:hypothetical protein [Chloroflexota bacterium]
MLKVKSVLKHWLLSVEDGLDLLRGLSGQTVLIGQSMVSPIRIWEGWMTSSESTPPWAVP